jgi:hypothetical protein
MRRHDVQILPLVNNRAGFFYLMSHSNYCFNDRNYILSDLSFLAIATKCDDFVVAMKYLIV